MLRACIDCGVLTDKGRCSTCTRPRQRRADQRRGTTTERGLGAEHQRLRKIILSASDVCWLCGQPGSTTVDHVVPRVRGGATTLGNLRPAHRSCNSARGGRGPVSVTGGQ